MLGVRCIDSETSNASLKLFDRKIASRFYGLENSARMSAESPFSIHWVRNQFDPHARFPCRTLHTPGARRQSNSSAPEFSISSLKTDLPNNNILQSILFVSFNFCDFFNFLRRLCATVPFYLPRYFSFLTPAIRLALLH